MHRMAHPLLVAIVVSLVAPAAHADDPSAARLYKEGWQLYKDKQYAEACPLLERSLASSPKIRTRVALALCYEASEKYASAYNTWRAVAEQAAVGGPGDAAMLKRAVEKTEQLVARITRIVLEPAGSPTGLQVWLDGRLLAANELNVPVPVDPGEHTIDAKAPEQVDWNSTFAIAATDAGETRSLPIGPLAPIERVRIDMLPTLDPLPPLPVPPPTPGSSRSVRDDGPRTPPLKYAAIASAGAGVVAIGVGTFFALGAKSNWDDAKAHGCSGDGVCRAQKDVDLINDAGSKATKGTISFAAGGALIAGGVAMWFLAPSPEKPEPAVKPDVFVGPGGAHVGLRGAF